MQVPKRFFKNMNLIFSSLKKFKNYRDDFLPAKNLKKAKKHKFKKNASLKTLKSINLIFCKLKKG